MGEGRDLGSSKRKGRESHGESWAALARSWVAGWWYIATGRRGKRRDVVVRGGERVEIW